MRRVAFVPKMQKDWAKVDGHLSSNFTLFLIISQVFLTFMGRIIQYFIALLSVFYMNVSTFSK